MLENHLRFVDSTENGYTLFVKYTEQDFEAIYYANNARISKYLIFKVQNMQDAQDITQDVFFAFYKIMMKSTTVIENPHAYLMQIANNELTRYYKKKSEQEITIDPVDELELIDSIPDDFELELAVLDRLSIDEVWEAIKQLSETEQTIMAARYRLDLTYQEIAEKLSLPESTVKFSIYRSIEKLKKKLIK